MKYRCPYCKHLLGAEPPPKCPDCGKVMVIPSMKETSERTARKRKVENIWRDAERQMSAMRGPVGAGVWRTPQLYLGAIVVLAVLGGALFKATDSAVQRRAEAPHLLAIQNIDALAEALGRYRFHVGNYPSVELGLFALIRDPETPKWNGPYVNQIRKDPWNVPFVYEPPKDGETLPVLLSCGPDRTRGTPDDLRAEPARFDPGTEWTNGWLSVRERMPGITILKALPEE